MKAEAATALAAKAAVNRFVSDILKPDILKLPVPRRTCGKAWLLCPLRNNHMTIKPMVRGWTLCLQNEDKRFFVCRAITLLTFRHQAMLGWQGVVEKSSSMDTETRMDGALFQKLGRIKAILFDKDGTLIDFEATWGPVNKRVGLMAANGDAKLAVRLLDRCGLDPLTGKVRAESILAIGAAHEIADALIAAGSKLSRADLLDQLHRLFDGAFANAAPFTDLPLLFQELRERAFQLGVASADTAKAVRQTLDTLHLTSHVDFQCGYDSGHGTKPGPGMINAFAAALSLPVSAIAMVGDSTHDLIMARNANAGLSIGVLSGTGTEQSLAPFADVLIPSVAGLPALFAVAKS
jgi:phosphoglycolate phosphatase